MRLVSLLGLVFASAIASAASARTLERPDGSEIVYHVDRAGRTDRQGLLLMLQGSGCEPVVDRAWLRSDPLVLSPGSAVLAIEKFGVGPDSAATVEGCSQAYWDGNTLRQRVLDAVQVVARMRREPWWNGRLIIHGGSEGGAVAAMLAPLLPEAVAVIVQSSGIGISVGELVRSAVPPPVVPQIDRALVEARADPVGSRRMGGASYRWWADAVDVVPARMLLQTDIPVLIIHGARDRNAPVAAARAARDLLASAGRGNVRYVEYPDYDHGMIDAAGADHGGEVLASASSWLREQAGPRSW